MRFDREKYMWVLEEVCRYIQKGGRDYCEYIGEAFEIYVLGADYCRGRFEASLVSYGVLMLNDSCEDTSLILD